MKTSITTIDRLKGWGQRLLALVFWLLVWQAAAWAMNSFLLPGPWTVAENLWALCRTGDFWRSIFLSFGRIALGFVLAVGVGTLLAILCHGSGWLRVFVAPLMTVIKATPVASFIILALVFLRSAWLSVFISFLMVLPVVFVNVTQGLSEVDPQLREMARVFRLGWRQRIRGLYLPSVMPYFFSACTVGLGFCWKAGIAAEVIGLPDFSIGERLYEAKINLNMGEMLAWTVTIVCISLVMERLVFYLMERVRRRWQDGSHSRKTV
ncbi:MAG: ABC transporter permease [Eubacteriales bacterium]|jgi:NitT/TauT family transport system permease protein